MAQAYLTHANPHQIRDGVEQPQISENTYLGDSAEIGVQPSGDSDGVGGIGLYGGYEQHPRVVLRRRAFLGGAILGFEAHSRTRGQVQRRQQLGDEFVLQVVQSDHVLQAAARTPGAIGCLRGLDRDQRIQAQGLTLAGSSDVAGQPGP